MNMTDKPLIALFTNNDDDVYCFRLELIQAMLNAGYRVLISSPDGPKFEVMEQAGLRKNIEFLYDNPPIDRRGTNAINDGKLAIHYWKLLNRYRPSVLLTYTAKPNVYAGLAAYRLHIPVIHNVTGLGSVVNESGLKRAFIMWLFKATYRASSCVMFQNSANMKVAQELGWVRGDCKLIPGSGVALERFPLQEYPDGGNGLEGAPIVFNYIGRILHDKGVDDYIEAARRIRKKYPKTEFNMLGFIEPTEAHYKAELDELGKQGVLFYRGSQKDVKPWIRRAHAIIHPSVYGEGMSNVLLENASSGRLIITTDNPGCRETVDDRVSGFIYHGGDVDALTRNIETVIRDMPNEARKQMGLKGRQKVEREFSREIVIRAYLEKIAELVVKDRKES